MNLPSGCPATSTNTDAITRICGFTYNDGISSESCILPYCELTDVTTLRQVVSHIIVTLRHALEQRRPTPRLSRRSILATSSRLLTGFAQLQRSSVVLVAM